MLLIILVTEKSSLTKSKFKTVSISRKMSRQIELYNYQILLMIVKYFVT
eukprot:UN19321